MTSSLPDLAKRFEPFFDLSTPWSQLSWLKRRGLVRDQKALETLLQQDPNNLDALLLLGRVHRRFGQYPEALAALSAVHAAAPEHASTAWELCWAALFTGEIRFALSVARTVQLENTPDADFGYQEGIALLLLGRTSEARRAFWEAHERGYDIDQSGLMVSLCDDIHAGRESSPRSMSELLTGIHG